MSRASSAAIAVLAILALSPLASARPVLATAAAPVTGEGAVGPSAKADPRGRFIVVYRDDADRTAADARARGRGIAPDRTYKAALKGYAARLSPSQHAAVEADPAVAYVTEDGIVRATDQTVPRGVRRVDAPRNTTARIDGSDERVDADVAIFDTGIDKSHPDLNVVGGYNCSSTTRTAWGDGNGHGTHVAGTVGALDNGTGVVGVAPGVRLWAVRILGSDGSGLVSWYVCGMDWIAAQRDPVDPTRPLIEAVNMSVAKPGSDDRNCGYTNKDAMHKAICRLVASGVTVVAAAGNNSFNAARLIPASYNEVITVSALADTDGKPGALGGNACYSWGSYDSDDTYANFSNYGADVDLIAPGKCIWSTLPGGHYGYSSGTSMAAPHVTGAAALWLASRPGRTPAEAKAALRAAATLDWRTSTDPDGNPDRLLDVSRLVALGDFNVEAGRVSSWTSAAGRTVSVPVTLIRAEDFTADVTLAAVPDAPLTASFDTATLTGGTLSTRVSITIPAKTPSGGYVVVIQAGDGARTRTAEIRLRVDSDRPVVAVPTLSPRTATTFATTSFAGRGRWTATDATSGVSRYEASWRVDGGTWSTPVSLAATRRYLDRTMYKGHKYELRVRARDVAGNVGSWASEPAYAWLVVQDTSASLTRSGVWRTAIRDVWSGGSSSYATAAGATTTRAFTGRAIAWVSGVGPTRGAARVWIDGVRVATVSTYAASRSFRRIVFATAWPVSATHTITIEVAGTADRPRVDLDALIVGR
jgi:subtilisin family serine protease